MALTQITEKGIKDGEIVNADINASAAIQGSKISPDFGSQNVVTTGNLTIGDSIIHSGDTDTKIRFSADGQVLFEIDGNDKLRLNDTGYIQAYDHIVPNNDSTKDLGLTGTRFRAAYVDTYYGDGSNLTGISSTTINNNASTKFITGTDNAGELDCEANLSYNNSLVTFANSNFSIDKSSDPTITLTESTGNKATQLRQDTGGLLRTLGNYPLLLGTNQTERMRISGSGNVGINESSPQQQLHVHDDTAYKGILINGNGAPRIGFARSTTADGEWSVGIDGTNGNHFVINNSNDNSNSKIILSSTQNTMTQLTQINGNLKFGSAGNGIDFSAQTASSETGATPGAEILDHYEEGTWTPTTSIGAMNNMHGAHYTKIGRLVNCQCYVTMPTSSASTQVRIDNFPFTSIGSNHYAIGSAYCQWQGTDQFYFQMSPSATHGYPHVGIGNAVTHATASGGYYLMSVTYLTA